MALRAVSNGTGRVREGARVGGGGAPTIPPNNLQLSSNDISASPWTPIRLSKGAGVVTPSGSTIYKMVEDTSDNSHVLLSGSLGEAGNVIFSFVIKAGERSVIRNFFDGVGHNFDASTGAWTNSPAGSTLGVIDLGGGFYRPYYKRAIAGSVTFNVQLEGGGTLFYLGDGVSGLYFGQVQFEMVTTETAPRAYIPT